MIAMPKAASLPLLVPPTTAEPALAQTPTERDYLSFSAIRTYQNCGLKYFFKSIAGLPEQTVSASLIFGSGIHRAIERHFQEQLAGNPVPTLPELLAAYESEWTGRGEELRLFDQDE